MDDRTEFKCATEKLAVDAFNIGVDCEVAELRHVPTSYEFDSVCYSKSTPLVIRNVTKKWHPVNKWSPEYFQYILGDKIVDVTVTPNGVGNGIADFNGQEYVVQPAVERMQMFTFLRHLKYRKPEAVYSLRIEYTDLSFGFPELAFDINPGIFKFAEDVLSKGPDAIHLCISDSRTISSMRKDPYDNLFFVTSGYMKFVLLPPHQLSFLPRKLYKTGIYRRNANGKFDIIPIPQDDAEMEDEWAEVPPKITEWIAIDPLYPNLSKYPRYSNTRPIRVRVNAGDMLYLQSDWYYYERHSHRCIAINLRYDVERDSRYSFFRMLEDLYPAQKVDE